MLDSIRHGDVLELKMNHPPANALGPVLIKKLLDGMLDAPRTGARGLVLSGMPKMFSAGLDVPELLTLDRAGMRSMWTDFFGLLRAIGGCPIPVAAALTGHSPAGGAVMAIFCDRRIMAEGAFRIGLNEVQVGLPMPEVIHRALIFCTGERVAARLASSAVLMEPDEALAAGLVDEVVPMDEVVQKAVAWITSLTRLPPVALRETRRLARAPLLEAFARLDDIGLESFLDVWFSPETQASMGALVERLAKRR